MLTFSRHGVAFQQNIQVLVGPEGPVPHQHPLSLFTEPTNRRICPCEHLHVVQISEYTPSKKSLTGTQWILMLRLRENIVGACPGG